jgi:uncharacterized protein (TIGR03492 family)
MSAVLFVSNGHGEEAIASRIAVELTRLNPALTIDHLALVGAFGHPSAMRDVGPRRVMPSGGLLAMGNVRNILRDVRGGLIGLTLSQRKFLRQARGAYAVVAAIGDVYALTMALQARAPTVFVGTAKSVHVAPYGKVEERILRRAYAVFVRDEATSQRLRAHGVDAQAPGNVIVDLFVGDGDPAAESALRDFAPPLVLFPGSREAAYSEGRAIVAAIAPLIESHPTLGAAMSIAPGLDVQRFADEFGRAGWHATPGNDAHIPFVLRAGAREFVRAWRGPVGPLLSHAALVVGQAGTANEAAAAAGVPVVALDLHETPKTAWYRKRQRGLLGEALVLVPGEPLAASREIAALLANDVQRARMGAVGRERMGRPGGALAVAHCIAELAA